MDTLEQTYADAGTDFQTDDHWAPGQDGETLSNGHDESPSDVPSILSHNEAAFGSAVQSEPAERAKQLTQTLAGTLQQLSQALEESEAHRAQAAQERSQLEDQIRGLEVHREAKERFAEILLKGPGGAISDDDLRAIQTMMEALTQDPDRLTVLFTVVQQAGKLATIVGDYVELRHTAEQGA